MAFEFMDNNRRKNAEKKDGSFATAVVSKDGKTARFADGEVIELPSEKVVPPLTVDEVFGNAFKKGF